MFTHSHSLQQSGGPPVGFPNEVRWGPAKRKDEEPSNLAKKTRFQGAREKGNYIQ